MADYSYLGSGKTYLRKVGDAVGLIEVGNCSALNFAVTEEEKELKDFTQPGGGTYNEVKRITAVECQITMHDMSPENLARALYGEASAVVGAAIEDEAITVYPGALSLLAKLPAASPTPTVVTPGGAAATRANDTVVALNAYIKPATPNTFYYKVTTAGTTAGSIPTFPTTIGATVTDGTAVLTCAGLLAPVADTDYEMRPGGVFVYEDKTLAGEAWTVDYTSVDSSVVQALVTSGQEYQLVFDGLNEARSGKRTRIEAFRVKIGALANLGLIGEDYAALEASGKLLKDTTKVGAGVSQYFKVDIEV